VPLQVICVGRWAAGTVQTLTCLGAGDAAGLASHPVNSKVKIRGLKKDNKCPLCRRKSAFGKRNKWLVVSIGSVSVYFLPLSHRIKNKELLRDHQDLVNIGVFHKYSVEIAPAL